MPLTLYGHRLSQPCRAAEILLRELDARYTWHEIDFAQGETHESWYAERINAFETVPALVVTPEKTSGAGADLRLAESHAIMRYLCRTASAQSDAWYPGDRNPARAAAIDQWLDWHLGHVRRHDMFHHIMNLHLTLPMLKREIQASLLAPLQDGLNRDLDVLERHLDTAAPQPTLCGGDQPSLADLAIACELYQIVAVGYRFDRYPRVQRWLDGLIARPHFSAVSETIAEQGRTIGEADGGYLALDSAFA